MAEEEAVFDPTALKKKKKKPKAMEEESATGAGALEEASTEAMFTGKKKKKTKVVVEEGESGGGKGETEETSRDEEGSGLLPWVHSYDALLGRVYGIMLARNPGMESGERKKIALKPPQCLRVGSKRTAFANFAEICRLLNRSPKHVLQFLLAELGASGSIDGNNQLIVKGRFQQKQFESVLRSYIKEYVSCHTCKSPDTVLEKDTRLNFLKCEVCGSRCSVAAIKTGFHAQVGKRAAARAAAGQ